MLPPPVGVVGVAARGVVKAGSVTTGYDILKYQELKVPLDLLFKVESIWKLQEINLEAAGVERC